MAKEEIAPAGAISSFVTTAGAISISISSLSQCFQMSSAAADLKTNIYGLKG